MDVAAHRPILRSTTAVAETASSCTESSSGKSKSRKKLSKGSKSAKSDGFTLSNVPLAQWIRAQAATVFIVLNFTVPGTGNGSIATGADFEQNAGSLTVGGNLSAQIGGSWNLGAVQDKDTTNVTTRGGFSNTQVIRQQTSSINVGGQTNINAT